MRQLYRAPRSTNLRHYVATPPRPIWRRPSLYIPLRPKGSLRPTPNDGRAVKCRDNLCPSRRMLSNPHRLRAMLWLVRRILKLDSPITVGQWIYDRLSGNWVLIVSLLGGVSMTYLAKITEWIRPWGPVGWGVVGLSSALLLALLISLATLVIAQATKRRAEARAIVRWSEKTIGLNPMDKEFRNQRINLIDLANPISRVIGGKRFINCEIIGPATVFLRGGKGGFRDITFAEANIIPIKSPFPLFSIYTVADCDFIECKFFAVTLLIPMQMIPIFEAGYVGSAAIPYLTLTGNPEIDKRQHPLATSLPALFSPSPSPAPPQPQAGTSQRTFP